MSVWNVKAKKLQQIAAGLLVVAVAGAAGTAQAQSTRIRRESSATRRARVERALTDTYTHRWEAGGGGGYLRWRSGPFLRKNNEITFWAETTYFLNRKLGVMGSVHGAYGNAKINNNIFNLPDPQVSEYTFLVGPSYRFYSREKASMSLFAQGGSAIGKFGDSSKGIKDTDLGLWPSSNAKAAFSVGAMLDYNLYPDLALRVSPTYVGTTFGSSVQHNYGLDLGIVYRFGRIH